MKQKKLISSFGIYENMYHNDSYVLLIFGERQSFEIPINNLTLK